MQTKGRSSGHLSAKQTMLCTSHKHTAAGNAATCLQKKLFLHRFLEKIFPRAEFRGVCSSFSSYGQKKQNNAAADLEGGMLLRGFRISQCHSLTFTLSPLVQLPCASACCPASLHCLLFQPHPSIKLRVPLFKISPIRGFAMCFFFFLHFRLATSNEVGAWTCICCHDKCFFQCSATKCQKKKKKAFTCGINGSSTTVVYGRSHEADFNMVSSE